MTVHSYDSWDDMVTDQTFHEMVANDGRLPQQIELQDDVDNHRYWMQPFPAGPCVIFGHTWSLPHYREDNRRHFDFDDPEDVREYEAECASVAERRERGYVFGRAFSILEPDGELGDSHVSMLWPITEEAFEEARAAGWKLTDVDPMTLAIVGEKTARMAGWTPLCVAALREMLASMR